MKRKRFSEEQIIRILHEAETLDNVREVCRQHNIAEQTLYHWRRQFGGWRSLRRSVCGRWSGRLPR
jgi:transposase-like protein